MAISTGNASSPIIALVGRPNVGKSSLFNRLTHTRDALVDNTPGLTRDRQYGWVRQDEKTFRVVDTGGFEADSGESITNLMRMQTLVAIEEADAVIFVADAKAGPLADDWEIVNLLRRSGKPLVCAVNKAESPQSQDAVLDFFGLGLQWVVPISATHGMGITELLSAVLQSFNWDELGAFPEDVERGVQVAVVGCPNAGKSSIINRLLGENRLVTSEIPGTTRDAIDLPFTDRDGHNFVLVDTAGMRRKSKVAQRIEKFSVMAALRAIDRADVAVLVLDAQRGVTDQDLRVAGLVIEAGKGLVLAVNKWDMIPGGRLARRDFDEKISHSFRYFDHAPVLYMSARSGLGVQALPKTVYQIWEMARQRISTGLLNRWLGEAIESHPPPRQGGRSVKIRYMTQVSVAPPTLLVFANRPDAVHETYQRYLENRFRAHFGFAGIPLRLKFRKGGDNPYLPTPPG